MRIAVALLGLMASAPSLADVFTLGTLSVPSLTPIGNTFTQLGNHRDDYVFSVNSSAQSDSLVFELDPLFNALDIDITRISLSTGTVFNDPGLAGVYDFGVLSAGTYTLSVFSTVTGLGSSLVRSVSVGFGDRVGYGGLLGLTRAPSASVPEPASLLLFGLGLTAVWFTLRRRVPLRLTP